MTAALAALLLAMQPAPAPPLPPAPPPISVISATPGTARGLTGAYDPLNPFARILRHERPAAIVYEDRWTLAFLSIGPVSPGHTLVIPKAPVRTIFGMTPALWRHVLATATRVAHAQVAALGATGVQLRQNNGADGEQSVFHLHLHVIPRYPGVALRAVNDTTVPTPAAELEPIAAKLRAAIAKER